MLKDFKLLNIVFVLVDNFGWGEFGCYGGGVFCGVVIFRIDKFVMEGLFFYNFNVESDCVLM